MSGFFGPASLAGGGFLQPPTGGATGFDALESEIVARHKANNPDQATVTIDVTFAPSDINTSTDKVTLVGTGLLNTNSRDTQGTPVFYENTGGSPATGMTNGAMYYLYQVSGNDFYIYPVPSGNDYQNIPWALEIEPYLHGQNFASDANRINFSDQGTGTHRFYSNPLVGTIKDMSPNGFHCYAAITNNRHTYCEIETDLDGKKRFLGRLHAREPGKPSYNILSKSYKQGTNTAERQACRGKFYGKRSVGIAYVTAPKLIVTRQYPKSQVKGTNISGSICTIELAPNTSTHPFVTGDLANCEARAGTLPAELNGDTYVRKGSNTTISFHPTPNDATNNTNAITPSVVADTNFIVFNPAKVGDFTHWNVLSLLYGPDQGPNFNIMAPRLQLYGPTGSGRLTLSSGNWSMSGATNGELFKTANSPNFVNGQKVYMFKPPRAITPNRNANDAGGSAIPGDYYFISRSPSDPADIRLHYTQAQSLASAPFATNLLAASTDAIKADPTAQCIKYQVTTISGQVLFEYADDRAHFGTNIRYSAAELPSFETTIPAEIVDLAGPRTMFAMEIDFNDPDETYPVMRLYVNGMLMEEYEYVLSDNEAGGTKGNLPADDGSIDTAMIIMGDNEPHGTMNGPIYEHVVLVGQPGERIPASDFLNIYNEWQAEYDL